MRAVMDEVRKVQHAPDDELVAKAKELGVSLELLQDVKRLGRLPVVNFAAGGVATPADAALMMQLGADGVFVGSGIFKASNPSATAKAVVKAVTYYQDPAAIAEASRGLGQAMAGISVQSMKPEQLLAPRGV
jgi:pyridoxal 5'-phosphate synthase pdxS subunit